MSDSLTTREVAAYFRKSPRTIRQWVRLGLLRPLAHCRPFQFPRNEITKRENQLKIVSIF